MRRGFTLVELSIVLVIIGLLIGGILVAQSMISTARIQSFVTQIQQYDAATLNFRTKYNGLPGDSIKFNPSGNDDGRILDAIGNDDSFDGEMANFWKNLAEGGFDGNTYSNNASGGIVYGVHIPAAKIGRDSGILAGYAIDTAAGMQVHVNKNVYAIVKWQGGYAGLYHDSQITESIPADEAFAADLKMDDGKPYAGNVMAFGNEPSYGGIELGDMARAACASSTDYNLSKSEPYPCGLSIILLSQVGQSSAQ